MTAARPRDEHHDPDARSGLGVVPGAPLVPVLPELDPTWSRTVVVADARGSDRTWHLLDTHAQRYRTGGAEADPGVEATVLCVHGNPTWSYLWRRVIAAAPAGWRVIAPDQLAMGYSEDPAADGGDPPRTLAERVADLTGLVDSLGVSGPIYLLAHDWGGPVGLGWAVEQRLRAGAVTESAASAPSPHLAGIVLTNTAIHQPEHVRGPALIKLAHAPGVRQAACHLTPIFVRATTGISRRGIDPEIRDAFSAPYQHSSRRRAVADFVADIPFATGHPSAPTLDGIAAGLADLADLPALLLWGMKDPVFSQTYLDDLIQRLPHADVHRYPDASHLVLEDAPDGVEVIWRWLTQRASGPQSSATDATAQVTGLDSTGNADDPDSADSADQSVPIAVNISDPDQLAIAELGGSGRQITFGELNARVAAVAAGLAARGVSAGQRVGVLVPPGIDLSTVVYAVWRLGAIVVVADTGLGVRRLGGALRGASPDHLIAIGRGLLLAKAARVPGQHLKFDPEDAEAIAADGAARVAELPAEPVVPDEADGAILFTSGATGPPKGVVYARAGLSAQVALLRRTFDLRPGTRFVAAFAPFALYGPALGLPSAVPDMDVTAPHTLTASALAQATRAIGAEVVFASPAALRNVAATADDLSPEDRTDLAGVRLLLSAGAPVPVPLLRRLRDLLPGADMQTPYGMTEALPVATINPTEALSGSDGTSNADDRGDTEGVCVGLPVPGVEVRIAPLAGSGAELTAEPGAFGELVVRGPHIKDRYDRLWATQEASARPPGWHRTGDVGQFDDQGRIWVLGRLAHVLHTPVGPVPPYGIEQRVEALPQVSAAAVVGVGPAGTQQVVVVVVPEHRLGRRLGTSTPLAPTSLIEQVRLVAGVPVAAVLLRDWLPVDIRHASKVDRTAVSVWATRWLHGRAAARALQARVGQAPTTRSR